MIVARGWRGGEMGILVKGYKLSVILKRFIISEDVTYSTVTIVNNTILYNILLRELTLNVPIKKPKTR